MCHANPGRLIPSFFHAVFVTIHESLPDLDMNIVIPNEDNIYRLFEMLEDKYGNASEYFEAIGVEEGVQKKIIQKLCQFYPDKKR